MRSSPARKRSARSELREAEVDGVRVSYRVAGAGPPLVCVHGLAGSSRWWEPVVPALAERRSVYLGDLPGFGGLGRRTRRVPLAAAAGWLVAWADAVGLERFGLAGHSMGAAIAVRVAAEGPERVEQLVLVAPAGLHLRPLVGHGLPLASTLRRSGPRLLWLLGRDAARAGPRTVVRATLEVAADDVRGELGRVRAPTLVVCGERDALVPPSVGELVRGELPDAELAVVAGAAHVPMVERPDACAEALLGFLEPGPDRAGGVTGT